MENVSSAQLPEKTDPEEYDVVVLPYYLIRKIKT
jgi:hypothetical protein